MGELQIDYNKLIWQQTVALRNVPQGTCAITLSEKDLANFVVHPIMMGAAARAVQVSGAHVHVWGGTVSGRHATSGSGSLDAHGPLCTHVAVGAYL